MSLFDKRATPEQVTKRSICAWLWQHQIKGHCMFWLNMSTGLWDARRQIYRKNQSRFGRLGVPDILGSWYGRPMGIEVKAPEIKDLFGKRIQSKGYPSEDQKKFIEDARARGWFAFVAWGIEDCVKELIESDFAKAAKADWERRRGA